MREWYKANKILLNNILILRFKLIYLTMVTYRFNSNDDIKTFV